MTMDDRDGVEVDGVEGVGASTVLEAVARAPGKAKRSRIYRSQPVDPTTGRRVSITSEIKEVVEARAAEFRGVRRGLRYGALTNEEGARRLGQGARRLMVCEAWETYVRARLTSDWANKAASIWTQHLKFSFGDLAVPELNVIRMSEWEKRQIASGLKCKTIKNHFDLLAAAVHLQIEARALDEVPWGTWKPRVERVEDEREACRSPEELERLIRAARARDALGRGFADLAFRVMLYALLGLRQGEASALGWDNVSLDGATPFIYIQFQVKTGWKTRFSDRPRDLPKHGKTRRFALDEIQVLALRAAQAHLQRWGMYRADGPVFPVFRRGVATWRSHPDAIDAARELRPCVVAAGLPNPELWVVHSLRHSFGTLGSDGDQIALQRAMGHADRETTAGYQHMRRRGLAKVSFGTLNMLPPGATGPLLLPAGPSRVDVPGEVPASTIALLEAVEGIGAAVEIEGGRVSRAEQVRRSKAKARGRGAVDLVQAFAAWSARGQPDCLPREVVGAATAAYHRGYTEKRRTELALGVDKELANVRAAAAGKLCARGVKASWGKVKKRMLEAAARAGLMAGKDGV
jgi:integrase